MLAYSQKTCEKMHKSSGELLSFAIKLAALEVVRRFSKAKCSMLWRLVQRFQVFGYPPFNWLPSWPLRLIARGAQSISRPMHLLSTAMSFSNDESQPLSGSISRLPSSDNLQSEESSEDISVENLLPQLTAEIDNRVISLPKRQSPESSKDVVFENLLLQLTAELENQGISLPKRQSEESSDNIFVENLPPQLTAEMENPVISLPERKSEESSEGRCS